MVEQTTAAAANLKTEAEGLARMVGRFRTGEESGVVRQMTAPSRSRPGPQSGPPPALEAQRTRLRAVANGGLSEEWTEF
ncbi:hypothetical protein D3C86_1696620 [compost metagenome]